MLKISYDTWLLLVTHLQKVLGVPYEETFAGIIEVKKLLLIIANLGVSSYSPKIYLF